MASTVWLLVEWIDLCDVTSSFGVVNMMDTFPCDESDLHPGKFIIVRVKHEMPRRAKILRTSESKRDVEEHKNTLELHSQQVKIVLNIGVGSINEPEYSFNAQQQTSSHSPLNLAVVAQNGNAINSSRQSIISCTLLPSRAQKKIRPCFDQGTQTEEELLYVPASTIEELEATLKKLYRYIFLGDFRIDKNNAQYEQKANVMRAETVEEVRAGTRKKLYRTCKFKKSQVKNMKSIGSTSTSESQHNNKASYIKQNKDDSWIYPNKTQYEQQANLLRTETVDEVGAGILKKLCNAFQLLKSEVNNMSSNSSTSTSALQHNDKASYIAQDVGDSRIDSNKNQYEQQANLVRTETVEKVGEETRKKLYNTYKFLTSQVNNTNSNGSSSTYVSPHNDEASYIAQNVGDSRIDTNNTQYEHQANQMRAETVKKVRAETRKKLYNTYKFLTSQVKNTNSNGSSSTYVSPHNDEASYIAQNVGDSRIDTNNTQYEHQANQMRAETVKKVRAETRKKLYNTYKFLTSQVKNTNSNVSSSTYVSPHNDEASYIAQNVGDSRIDTNNTQYEQQANLMRAETVEEVGAKTRKKLYNTFKFLTPQVNNTNSNGSSSTSVSQDNDDALHIDPNVGDSWINTNNTQYEQQANLKRIETVEEVKALTLNKLNCGYNFLKCQVNNMNSNGLTSTSASQHNDKESYIEPHIGDSWIHTKNTQYEQQANLMIPETIEELGAGTLKNVFSTYKFNESQVNTMNSNGSTSTSVSQHNDEASYITQNAGDPWIYPNNSQYEQQADLARAETVEKVGAETLKKVYSRYHILKSQVYNMNSNGLTSTSVSQHNDEASYIKQNVGDSWIYPNNTQYEQGTNQIRAESVEEVRKDGVVEDKDDNGGEQRINSSTVKAEEKFDTLRVRRLSQLTTKNVENMNDVYMVPIGSGNAKVSARLLNDIDWNSYTSATSQLLQAIFTRRVLATHSLIVKQSPAFMSRLPKKILDPQLVDDIMKTVSTKCGVPKNLVRNFITMKCTDEAKLYRNWQIANTGNKTSKLTYLCNKTTKTFHLQRPHGMHYS